MSGGRPAGPPVTILALAIGGALLFMVAARSSHLSAPADPVPGAGVAAPTIRVVAGLIPPYMNAEGEGRESVAIRSTLGAQAAAGDVEFFVLPFSRHWTSFLNDDRFDAVATVPDGMSLEGFHSRPYITYQNGIGYRCADHPGTFAADDLDGLHIVAFSGASAVLEAIRQRMPAFESYIEIANQRVHSQMLIDGRADAIVADESIFAYYNDEIRAGLAPDAREAVPELCFAAIFPQTDYHMVFRSEALRDLFDSGTPAAGAGDGRRRP
ncbi:hypothetical protein [Amorphus sp. MBR-141]